jgi:hypothetical protein
MPQALLWGHHSAEPAGGFGRQPGGAWGFVMHSSTTLFTVGTALRRAENNNLPVEVLVHGQWLRGTVAGVDGHGVILSTPSEHAVVRLDSISAVRIPETMTESSVAETFDQQHQLAVADAQNDDRAFAMPGATTA